MQIVNIENVIPRHKALSILNKLPLFAHVQDSEFDELLELCTLRKFKRDIVVFEQNSPARSLFVVLAGFFEISTQEKGVVNVMRQGEVVGELGIITELPRQASARSLTDNSLLLEIKKSDLDFLVGRQPHLSYTIMHNLAAELAQRYLGLNKDSFSPRSPFMPRVKNISIQAGVRSGPIPVRFASEKLKQVTHFHIGKIHNGHLYQGQGDKQIHEGDLIEIAMGELGLCFEVINDELGKGWFDIQLSTSDNKILRDTDIATVYVFSYG